MEVAGNIALRQNAFLVDFNNGSAGVLSAEDVAVVVTATDLSVTTTTTPNDEPVVGVVLVGGDPGTTIIVALGGVFFRYSAVHMT